MYQLIRSARLYFWPIIAANIVAMSVAVGANPIRALEFSIAVSCLASFGFLLNDLWDREVDRINRVDDTKPFIHSSSTLRSIAGVVTAILLLAGLGFSYPLGVPEFRVAAGVALGLGGYTLILRRFLLVPTIMAAILASSPLWIPLVLWAGTFDKSKWLFIVGIVLMLAAREILMDVRDRVGDIAGGRDTLATVFSDKIGRFVGIILIATAGIPFVVGIASKGLHLPIISMIGVGIVTGTVLYLLIYPALRTFMEAQGERKEIRDFMSRSRLAMVLLPLLILILWQ